MRPYRLLTLLLLGLLDVSRGAPVECKLCKGNCNAASLSAVAANGTAVNGTEMADQDGDLLQSVEQHEAALRNKRAASSVQKRPCGARLQLELILIPASICMIPLALCGILLCVCFCGPKETRGKLPEKMWGFTLAQPKKSKRSRHNTEDELDYGDGYVQRKDSKKTRFNTNVLVIERRRESAVTMGSSSPRPSPATPDSVKRTRFNQEISVIDEDTVHTTRL